MRHLKAHRRLGRNSAHRKALLRNLVLSLFVSKSGRIKTTVIKAKEARPLAEKLITLGKRESVHARRLARRVLPDRMVVKHLFDDIAPRYADRPGGYTRILRIGPRQGDNADMALLELVDIAEERQRAAKESGGADATKKGDDAADTAAAEAKKAKAEAKKAKVEANKANRAEVKRATASKAKPTAASKKARTKSSAATKKG